MTFYATQSLLQQNNFFLVKSHTAKQDHLLNIHAIALVCTYYLQHFFIRPCFSNIEHQGMVTHCAYFTTPFSVILTTV